MLSAKRVASNSNLGIVRSKCLNIFIEAGGSANQISSESEFSSSNNYKSAFAELLSSKAVIGYPIFVETSRKSGKQQSRQETTAAKMAERRAPKY